MSDQYGNFQGVPQTPAPAPYHKPPHGRLDQGYPAAAQKPRPGITVMLALAAILILVALRIVDFFLAASIDSLDASSWRSLLFTIFLHSMRLPGVSGEAFGLYCPDDIIGACNRRGI